MTFAECCLSLLVATKSASKQSARNVSHVLCSSCTHGVCAMWFQVNDNATRHQSISMNFTNHKQLHLLFFLVLTKANQCQRWCVSGVASSSAHLTSQWLLANLQSVLTSGKHSRGSTQQQTRPSICDLFCFFNLDCLRTVGANALPESERIRSKVRPLMRQGGTIEREKE